MCLAVVPLPRQAFASLEHIHKSMNSEKSKRNEETVKTFTVILASTSTSTRIRSTISPPDLPSTAAEDSSLLAKAQKTTVRGSKPTPPKFKTKDQTPKLTPQRFSVVVHIFKTNGGGLANGERSVLGSVCLAIALVSLM